MKSERCLRAARRCEVRWKESSVSRSVNEVRDIHEMIGHRGSAPCGYLEKKSARNSRLARASLAPPYPGVSRRRMLCDGRAPMHSRYSFHCTTALHSAWLW